MTDLQKEKVQKLRHAGKDYACIASELGLTMNSIKVFCYRNHLTDHDIEEALSKSSGICPNCHNAIQQRIKVKPRRFCSDDCRIQWWKNHPEYKNKKAFYSVVCNECGKEFMSYGNKNRKYCSRACYLQARFGVKGSTNDEGAM